MDEMLTPGGTSGHRLIWTLEQLLESVAVSRSTVYRWIERDGLPVVRVGKGSNPLFLPESVLAWFQSREGQSRNRRNGPTATTVSLTSERLAELRRTTRRPTTRRVPPPPIQTAGSRERLRRIRGAR
jgi:excisionase family DNA binding protein